MTKGSTREQLLQAAERLVRSRGYSAISYADLAEAVGIRKASIHHHFPGKADLGVALTDEYVERFETLLATIAREEHGALGRIQRYGAVYEASLREGMLCLCGMLATEIQVLPDEVRSGIRRFFTQQIAWLTRVLDEGVARGELRLNGRTGPAAERIFAALQGATLVAWGMGDPSVVARATAALQSDLRG